MSSAIAPFVPRVFSQPTEDERARLSRPSSLEEDDNEAVPVMMGTVFTAPAHTDKETATDGKSVGEEPLADVHDENKDARHSNSAVPHNALGDHPTDSKKIGKEGKDLLETSVHLPVEATQPVSGDVNSTTADEEAYDDMPDLVALYSDDEYDQPSGFAFLEHLDVDALDTCSENDTRSSGWTEPSPLRPRRLFPTTASTATGNSTILVLSPNYWREVIQRHKEWEDRQSTADLSTIADFNDLSQYNGDLEDELDGEEEEGDDDEDEEDSDYEYSSACSSLSGSESSDSDDDFFDATSESGDTEEEAL